MNCKNLAPWLSVRGSAKAVEFYKNAFNAIEMFRLEDSRGGVVARLAIGDAEFWLSEESPEHDNFSPEMLGGSTARMILTVDDPDKAFMQAIRAGGVEVSAVVVEHGWRAGRLVDPFGHHWEIGCPVE